jgi:hypothetical protein
MVKFKIYHQKIGSKIYGKTLISTLAMVVCLCFFYKKSPRKFLEKEKS